MNILFLRLPIFLALLYPSELSPINCPWQCPPTDQQLKILGAIGNMVPPSMFPPLSFVQSNPFMSGSPCNVIMSSTESGQSSFHRNQDICHLLALNNSQTIQLGSSVIAPIQPYPLPLTQLPTNLFFNYLLTNQLLQNNLLKVYFLYNYPIWNSPAPSSQIIIEHPDIKELGTSDLQDLSLKLNVLCSGGRICTIAVGKQEHKNCSNDKFTEKNHHRFGEETAEKNAKIIHGIKDWGAGTARPRTTVITDESYEDESTEWEMEESEGPYGDFHDKNIGDIKGNAEEQETTITNKGKGTTITNKGKGTTKTNKGKGTTKSNKGKKTTITNEGKGTTMAYEEHIKTTKGVHSNNGKGRNKATIVERKRLILDYDEKDVLVNIEG